MLRHYKVEFRSGALTPYFRRALLCLFALCIWIIL